MAGAVRPPPRRVRAREAVTLPDFFAGTPADAVARRPAGGACVRDVVRRPPLPDRSSPPRPVLRAARLRAEPCREFWEDLEPERRKRPDPRFPTRRGSNSDPGALCTRERLGRASPTSPLTRRRPSSNENPLLRAVGAAGARQHPAAQPALRVRLRCRFEDPLAAAARPSLLARLQQSVFSIASRCTQSRTSPPTRAWRCGRAPARGASWRPIAAEIWSLVREDEARERRGRPTRAPVALQRLRGDRAARRGGDVPAAGPRRLSRGLGLTPHRLRPGAGGGQRDRRGDRASARAAKRASSDGPTCCGW